MEDFGDKSLAASLNSGAPARTLANLTPQGSYVRAASLCHRPLLMGATLQPTPIATGPHLPQALLPQLALQEGLPLLPCPRSACRQDGR